MEKALEEHPDLLEEVQELQAQQLFLSENGEKEHQEICWRISRRD